MEPSRYLDEFVFRHNRRGTPLAGFQTLLGLGTVHQPIAYHEITRRAKTHAADKPDKHEQRYGGDRGRRSAPSRTFRRLKASL